MPMKVDDLNHEQLDYWVAKAKGLTVRPAEDGDGFVYNPSAMAKPVRWSPTRYWSQGGPIIEEAHIDLNWDWEDTAVWSASMAPDVNTQGETVLEAAMKAYVTAKFGDTLI